MAYTQCVIAGVNTFVDPDNVSQNIRPFAKVVPSLDGTIFATYLSQNPANIGHMESISISGMYLGTAAVELLKNSAKAREIISVEGVPGVDELTQFIITAIQQSPIKPGVPFPGEDADSPPVKHSYTISLEKVSDF
jgi:hypothetical protein